MKHQGVLFGAVLTAALSGVAHSAPLAGQDYYSWQIASAPTARALDNAFAQHATMPFVRIEQRGAMFVLRAGFWSDLSAARAAVSQSASGEKLLRVATYRPTAIARKNWNESESRDGTETLKEVESPSLSLVSPTVESDRKGRPSQPDVRPLPGMRPFDPQDYALAFDAFVAAGDLQRAFEVAQKAVRSVPQDRAWRMRLATVSQWTERPQVMAEQWIALFEQGDHSPATAAKVIEVASLVDRPLVALDAWAVYARSRSLSDAQWRDVLDLYESLAQPERGSDFFVAQFKKTQHPLLLEYAAQLAGNAGNDARAEMLYAQRAELEPFSLDSVLRAVVNQVRRGRMREALTLMKTHENRIPADAIEFWRLFSQVAWELRDYELSRQGYERYARLPQAVSADWSRLIFLVRRDHPGQAADLAIEAYRRFGATDQLLQGLGIYAELGDVASQARVFAMLGENAAILASTDTRFLLQRAQFYQKQKNTDAAWKDLRRAMGLAPDDLDAALASLWFLIDTQRTTELTAFLDSHTRMAQGQSALWAGYAAANQLLEHHREAVRWYDRVAKTKPDDPLMLLNYADARERIGQHGVADRLRRHAWLQLKSRYPDPAAVRSAAQSSELLTFARLSLLDRSGDPGLALVRQLVRESRSLAPEKQDSQTLTLVLGWAILKEQFPNARSWMWRRYARQSLSQAPLWGQAQVASNLDDKRSMDALLLRSGEALPIYNRYDIAYALGHKQQALDIAFKGMVPQDDEPLHDRYRQHAPLLANYLQTGIRVERGSEMDSHRLHFEARMAFSPEVFLVVGGATQQQNGKEPLFTALAPSRDQMGSAEVQWMGPRGATRLALLQRNALESWTGLRWGNSYQWDARLNLESVLNYRTTSTISQPMQVAGFEDNMSATLNYTLGKREFVRLTPQFARYYTQFGSALGSSQSLDVEAGYRFRTEYPDWRMRAFVQYVEYSRVGAIDDAALARLPGPIQSAVTAGAIDPVAYFIPQGSSRAGVCVDMGENLGGQNMQNNYSRAWRPFVNLCMSRDALAGSGFSGSVGMVGSITGPDHMRVQWDSTQAAVPGKGSAGALTLRYRHYF